MLLNSTLDDLEMNNDSFGITNDLNNLDETNTNDESSESFNDNSANDI